MPGILADRAVAPERFRLSGAVPRAAVRPGDRDELCETLRAATRDGLTVVPWGAGTSLASVRAPERYDLAIDLTGLDRVIEYEPEDLTLTAECGVTLGALGERLAARGQELPLEAPDVARATLGGVLAANASGARRMRFGAPRDRILGARFVLGDGTLVRTGGKVVKNVAGYGIHRLLCGSRGGLAIVVDASLKLQPAPGARLALIAEVTPDELADPARWAPFARVEPAALTIVGREAARGLPGAAGKAPFWIAVGFEDDAPRLAELAALSATPMGSGVMRLEGTDVIALWQRLADLETRAPRRLTFTSPHRSPSAFTAVADAGMLEGAVFHAAAGRLHVFPDGLADSAAPGLVQRLAAAGFALIDSPGLPGLVPEPPPALSVLHLRRSIRAALDPAGRFALGGNPEGWPG